MLQWSRTHVGPAGVWRCRCVAWAALLVAVLTSRGAVASAKDEKLIAYVHVGHGKVASTSFQNSLLRNAKLLEESYNIAQFKLPGCSGNTFAMALGRVFHYGNPDPIPNDRMELGWGHHPPSEKCKAGHKGVIEASRVLVGDFIKQGKNVILSSEYFGSWTTQSAEYLKDVFDGFELRVLVMVRHPLRWAMSLHAQNWRHKRTNEWLSELVDNAVKHQMNRTIATSVDSLNQFVEVIGPAQTFVGSLDGIIAAHYAPDQGILQKFCGVDPDKVVSAHSNASPSHYALEMIHFLSEFAGKKLLRWPRYDRQMADFEEDLQRFSDTLGEECWQCHDYADDFAPAEYAFQRAVDETGATELFFDEEKDVEQARYYPLGSLVICHGDAKKLAADKPRAKQILAEIDAFKQKWG
uniref:Sulfotransferase domain-containing protein n=1 Tax=Pinguiococcus pyrenoidosus TaxID=172671 RepID=A0A7R9YEB7_9STRA|mmetsp:Transcript_4698/g.18775  ORF Transcript_4698/g.18775 Transcript_4698/m.18775 type:complete len:409 (+) Transcript_4698:61-1287(+)